MSYKVLILEDKKTDALLMEQYLKRSGEPFKSIKKVFKKNEYKKALQTFKPDLVISDYNLINFNGFEAIRLKNKISEGIPLIIVSGMIGEEKAVELIKEGAVDFLIKEDAEKRLPQVAKRAIDEFEERKKRKKAEESLKDTLYRYRMLFEASLDGIIIGEPDNKGNVVDANKAICDLLGYTLAELKQLERADFVVLESPSNGNILKERETKGRFGGEMVFRHKTGEHIPVEVTSSIINLGNQKRRSFTIVRDIRERKKAQEKLEWNRQSQELQKDIAQIINQNIEFNEAVKLCLKRINRFIGWSVAHVYFRESSEPENLYSPLDIWDFKSERTLNGLINATQKKYFSVGEGMIGDVARKKNTCWFDIHAQKQKYLRYEQAKSADITKGLMVPIVVNGHTEAVFEFYNKKQKPVDEDVIEVLKSVSEQIGRLIERKRHLDDLKKEKERFRLLADNSTDMISRHTPDGKYIYASPACKQITGYEQEELIGTDVYSYFHPDEINRISELHQTILEDKNIYTVRYRFKQKDGSWRWVEALGKVLRDHETGEVYEIQNTTRDISERKEFERSLKEQIGLNEQIIQSLPGLFFIISLDDEEVLRFNNKLQDILGYSDWDLKSTHFLEFVAEEDREKALNSINKAFEQGTVEVELKLQSKSGKSIPFLMTGIVSEMDNKPVLLGTGIDIEDRIRAENELKREKDFIERAINSLPGLFYVLDENNNYERVNQNFLNNLGYSWDELKQINPLDFYLEKDHERVKEAINIAFTEGDAILVSQLKTKDGDLPWYYLTGTYFNENGKDFILGTGIDITERKKLEDLLQQAHQLARIGAWEVDLVNNEINWTPVTKQIHEVELDFEPDLETSVNFYKEGIHRETIRNAIREAIEKGTDWDHELKIVTAKGNDRWVRAIGKSEFRDGKCIRLYGSFQDIDESKRIQQRLKTAQNIANLGYWSYDLINNKPDWSEEVYRIWEQDPKSFYPTLENMLETIHPADREFFKREVEEIFSDDVYSNNEHRIVTPDGKVKWVHSRVILIKDNNGKPIMLSGTAQDITQQKEREEQLKKALHEKEILMMEVHHRVKNNLALISGILQLQALQTQNDDVFQQLTNSESRIQSIAIIHELLYQSESFARVNLMSEIRELIEHVSQSLRSTTEIKYDLNLIPVILNVNQAIPCAMIINEVLTNIYKHAFKEREKGNEVHIKLTSEEETVHLEISDNGLGLPEGFVLAEQTTLGFKLINTLSQQLDGDITYTSSEKGSIFSLSFRKKEESRGGGSHFL